MRGRFNDRAPGSIINLMDEDTVYSHRNTLGIKDYEGGKLATTSIGSGFSNRIDISSKSGLTVSIDSGPPTEISGSITIFQGSSGTAHKVTTLVKN